MLPPCNMVVCGEGLPLVTDVRSLGSLRRRGGGVDSGREPGTDASRAFAGPAARAVPSSGFCRGAALGWNQFLKVERDSRGLATRRERGRGRDGEEILARKPVLMSLQAAS